MRWSNCGHRRKDKHPFGGSFGGPFGKWPPKESPWGWTGRDGTDPGIDRLRKIPERGYVSGVCAGIGEKLGVEAYLVRLAFVGMGFIAGPLAVFFYFVLAVALPRGVPADRWRADDWARANGARTDADGPDAGARGMEDDEDRRGAGDRYAERPGAEPRADRSPSEVLAELRAMTEDYERRVTDMERHVTTGAFHLDKAFRDLDRDRP